MNVLDVLLPAHIIDVLTAEPQERSDLLLAVVLLEPKVANTSGLGVEPVLDLVVVLEGEEVAVSSSGHGSLSVGWLR